MYSRALGEFIYDIYEAASRQPIVFAMTTALVMLAFYETYQYFDRTGHHLHVIETSITASCNWLVGETKECSSDVLTPASFRKRQASAVTGMDNEIGEFASEGFRCDDGPNHTMNVRAYGRLRQPEYGKIFWRCTRTADSFECRETSGRPLQATEK